MLDLKYTKLQEILKEMRTVVIAFSGGVDSTFLLKAALDTLGRENVLAVTADSETYPFEELQEAIKLTEQLGARHEVIQTSELNIPGYSENTSNRCYFCKKSLFEHLVPIMEEGNYSNVAFGLIADDLGEHRPGTKAAREYNVRGPLQEADLYKSEIRELSQQMGLPTWDKPSFACLSSRIAYGEHITIEKLKKIDKSEQAIRAIGIRQVRVRTHGEIARIEVEPQEMQRLLENHQEITAKLQEFGYTYVTMDFIGYKSGSMNKVLQQAER
ncbi:ATP-dependent sacrificial sulfur transferase LarE [Neobacillus sp. SuZ13]|uniref:ATP-dependent sacrificial sulfur transferase LarE n=1 Tax=Neobacillus sp. SuZ13 TaxID=3047875 RepID=UPI0024C04C1D|nr:ATP-dependent sacrificial sulfur transferase LarE [Neobacillus sp. SuZ13]WHY68109.1 ATP-dependent sacrificial sulfur transferase LarE [Neobacillus sp. SuZ13]